MINNSIICGILHLSSKISYGVGKDGVVIKRFTALNPINCSDDGDTKYKIFNVGTKKGFNARDWYCTIKFNGIIDKKTNVPNGTIQQYIGEIGNYEAEMKCIKMLCLTTGGHLWAKDNIFQTDSYLNDIYHKDRKEDFLGNKNCEIYSIDPLGCVDIDDAIHVVKRNDGSYDIGIHISDVSSYIPKNSPLDLELSNRCESIYLKDCQINMLPAELVELCSLTQKKNKRVFSIVITLDGTSYDILDVKFNHNIIRVTRNLSYDEAQKLIDKKANSSLNLMYDIGKHLHKTKKNKSDQPYDTHIMVENYMVLANTLVAQYISKNNKDQILCRRHSGSRKELYDQQDQQIPTHLIDKANILLMEKAEYCVGNSDNLEKMSHIGLGKELYTHFTSPMRRYFDIIVHRLLSGQKELDNCSKQLVKHMNDTHALYNKCEKLSNQLQQIYQLQDINSSDTFVMSGWIIHIDDNSNKVKIYIKDLDMIVDSMLFSNKLSHLVNVFRTLDHNEDMIILRSNTEPDKKILLKMFQQVTIRIAITLSLTHKLLTKIIDPDIMSIFDNDYMQDNDEELIY